jgi:YD repeat-containing protein
MTGRVFAPVLMVGFLCTLTPVTRADDPPATGGVPRLPPLRPGVPKPWEDPGAALGSDDLETISASGNLRMRVPLFVWATPGVGPAIGLAYVYNSADVSFEGPLGHSVRLDAAATLGVDADGVVTITEPDGTPRSFRPAGEGFVGETFERCELARTGSGYELRHAGGFVRTFTTGHGRFLETARRDRVGDVATFVYDDADRLVEVRDSVGRSARLHVDGARYDAIVDPEGHTFHLIYSSGYLIQIRGPSLAATGETLTLNFYWDGPSRQLLGRSTWSGAPGAIYKYDAANRVTSIRSFDGASRDLVYGDGSVTLQNASGAFTFRYVDGALAEHVDPQGRRTRFDRDARRRPVAITDPSGRQDRYEYDDGDNRIAHVDGAGRRTTSIFDTRHRPIVVTDSIGQVTRMAYNELDLVTSRTDAAGDTTSYGYDEVGNLVSIVDFAGVTRYAATYNAHGHPVSVTDELGRTTTTTYDERGSWIAVSAPDGRTVTRTVSALGRTLASTNELGEMTTPGYDELGRAISTAGSFGAAARVVADAEGRIVSFEDRAGPTPQAATLTWGPDRYVTSNTLNGRPVRTAAPVSP